MHLLKTRPTAAAVIVALALLVGVAGPLLATPAGVAHAASCLEPGWVTWANSGWKSVGGGHYQIETQVQKLVDSANGLYCGQVRSFSYYKNINGGDTLIQCTGTGDSYSELLRSSSVLTKKCAATLYLPNGGTYYVATSAYSVAAGTCGIWSKMAWGQIAASTQTSQVCI